MCGCVRAVICSGVHGVLLFGFIFKDGLFWELHDELPSFMFASV